MCQTSSVATDDMLDLMKAVADEVINPRFGTLVAGDIEEKAPQDYVTAADTEAEELLTAELQRRYPGALIVGEEATFVDADALTKLATADLAFTIDPVDGTANFVRANPDHAVMIAELHSGEVVRTWVWHPQHETAYVAERGAGVTLNGVPMKPATPGADLLRGRTARRAWLGREFSGIAPVEFHRRSASIDYPDVATGVIDYIVYGHTKPWDHLPNLLMLRELGGNIVHLDGSLYGAASPLTEPIVAGITTEIAQRVAASWKR